MVRLWIFKAVFRRRFRRKIYKVLKWISLTSAVLVFAISQLFPYRYYRRPAPSYVTKGRHSFCPRTSDKSLFDFSKSPKVFLALSKLNQKVVSQIGNIASCLRQTGIKSVEVVSGIVAHISVESEQSGYLSRLDKAASHTWAHQMNTSSGDIAVGIMYEQANIFQDDNLTAEFLSKAKSHWKCMWISEIHALDAMRTRTVLSLHLLDLRTTYAPFTTTLCTHATSNRFSNIQLLVSFWDEPVVAAIYTKSTHFVEMYATAAAWLTSISRHNVLLLFVLAEDTFYPINWLRNLAFQEAFTEYVMLHDADFMPSEGLPEVLARNLRNLAAKRDPDYRRPFALIIPAFELREQVDKDQPKIPRNRAELKKYFRRGVITVFHKRIRRTHGRTGYNLWMKDGAPLYPIMKGECYRDYEPYFVMHKSEMPYAPEFFLERYQNKVVYFHMACLGNRAKFYVLRNSFVLHLPHPDSLAALNFSIRSPLEGCAHLGRDLLYQRLRKKN